MAMGGENRVAVIKICFTGYISPVLDTHVLYLRCYWNHHSNYHCDFILPDRAQLQQGSQRKRWVKI